jgi:transposase-like protein
MRKKYDKAFKAKIALEAIREEKTLQEIAVAYSVHPNLVAQWKSHLRKGSEQVFERQGKGQESGAEAKAEQKQDELYRQVGKLQVENDFLKKKYRQLYGSEPDL